MGSDVSRLALISGTTVAINEAWAIKNGREPVTPLIAGGIGFVVLSVAGGIWRWDIVNAIAAVFLLSAVVRHGLPLGSDLAKIANAGPAKKTPAAATVKAGNGVSAQAAKNANQFGK